MTEWRATTIGEVLADIVAGHSPKTDGRCARPGEFGVLKLSAISWGTFQPEENKALPKTYRVPPELTIRAGDLLMSRANTVELVGAVVQTEEAHPNLMLSDKTLRLEPRADIVDPRFLMYALRTADVRTAFEGDATGTSDSMRNLSQEKIRSAPLRLPPLDVQRRIVKKLDELLAQSRAAREQLEAVPALVETFRQSVLAAAFRGDLTADWRKKNPNVEPASKLLERIRVERRKKWGEGELAKMKAKGKVPKDDKWKAKYVEPEPVDATDLPELPPTWCWVTAEELAADERYSTAIGPFGSSLMVKDYRGEGVPLVFVRDIRARSFGGPHTKFVTRPKSVELNPHAVNPGDVLMTKMGDPPGDTAVYPDGAQRGVITADCIKLTPERRLVSSSWAAAALGAGACAEQVRQATRGVAQQKISLELFRRIAVPVAPFAEQAEVMRAVDGMQGCVPALSSQALEEDLQLLERALLAKAFRGELDLDGTDADSGARAFARRSARTVTGPVSPAA